MEPITSLTKQNIPFKWGQDQEESFNATLTAIVNTILCIYLDLNLTSIIYSDTSQKYSMGAMFTQAQRGVKQIISAFSQKFNKAQLKYPVGQQELLAAYKACKHFHTIIYGYEVTIQCDHMKITKADT